ncbi:hypothetical protein AVEN_165721-1 [Araneus ventricosus]|uniref:Uncharacterized protein n=1 Tax=Araneus ventricosus TaxID=182803 RepID=A0A4Y2C563_ARAVE|nr:hypothetical protein AVEN_165721-1 [Araneus ventricosus]
MGEHPNGMLLICQVSSRIEFPKSCPLLVRYIAGSGSISELFKMVKTGHKYNCGGLILVLRLMEQEFSAEDGAPNQQQVIKSRNKIQVFHISNYLKGIFKEIVRKKQPGWFMCFGQEPKQQKSIRARLHFSD